MFGWQVFLLHKILHTPCVIFMLGFSCTDVHYMLSLGGRFRCACSYLCEKLCVLVDDWASSSSRDMQGIKEAVGEVMSSMQQFSQSQQSRSEVG